jgi:hypothetical protein
LGVNTRLKKVFSILLAFAVLAFGMQSPCMAAFQEDTCTASSCCDEEAPAPEDGEEGNTGEDGNCCVYNVLSTPDNPVLITRYIPSTTLKAKSKEVSLPDELLFDFWQPPRLS